MAGLTTIELLLALLAAALIVVPAAATWRQSALTWPRRPTKSSRPATGPRHATDYIPGTTSTTPGPDAGGNAEDTRRTTAVAGPDTAPSYPTRYDQSAGSE